MVIAQYAAEAGDGAGLELAALLVLAQGSQGEAEQAGRPQCEWVVLAQHAAGMLTWPFIISKLFGFSSALNTNSMCPRAMGSALAPRSRRHLEQVLADYVRHYNDARPHRGINLGLPAASGEPTPATVAQIARIERVDVLGGLIHEYRHAA